MSKHSIDLNCDVGEGMPHDEALMKYMSSANIACGYHAGNETIMQRTIELCLKHQVAIGAHPGFRDKENFGRVEMSLSAAALQDLIAEQIHIIKKHCISHGVMLHHVKLHGALYNMAARSAEMSEVFARTVKAIDSSLIVYGLSGSHTILQASLQGLPIANEVFADRTYQADATLTPRTQANALIKNQQASLEQVILMVKHQKVKTVSGNEVPLTVDTICLHGDGEHAVSFAQIIKHFLEANNINIQTIQA